MAELQQIAFQFKNVQLLKDQSLGIGSYGAVCKAKCDDLICAAKIIHPTLFDPTALHQIASQRQHRLPIRRFEQECEFMSAIRHPNIVQYLGMFRDTDTHLPVLLMELMDNSLTHFLESSTQPIPYHIQVNICYDITLALSFLHSNNIVHRDLSSNNVLLRGNVLAKVTDFGMARLGDINPRATRFTNTMCPGTDVYMPPEAVQDKPVYTEKIDCFSFGVITVQIFTREFPKPGDRLQRIELNHPGVHKGSVLVEVPEIDRRQNHISQIPPNHSLRLITLDCLKDEENERPSAHQLCERVAGLKGMPNYIESARTIQDVDIDEVIHSQAIRMEETERTISSKEEEIQRLRQLQQEKDQTIKQLEERERRLNQQLRQLQQDYDQALTNFKLRWREGKRAPSAIQRWCDAVVYGNAVYVWRYDSVEIYLYTVTNNSWSQLPDCIHQYGSIAIINGWLTTVGRGMSKNYSNELFSLTVEGRWTKIFPPMPTKRGDTTALFTGTTLIVAGGYGVSGEVLSTVELMSIKNHQWSAAADLPEPMYCVSATIIGDHIYMLGGVNKEFNSSESVYKCSVSALLQSCIPNSRSLEDRFERTYLVDKASIWRQLTNLPVTRSVFSPFMVDCWQLEGERTQEKPPQLYI